MREKLKNPKVRIIIGVLAIILVVLIVGKINDYVKEKQAKRELEEARKELQEALSGLTPFDNPNNGGNNEETNSSSKTEQNLNSNVDIETLRNEQKLVCTSAKILIQDNEHKALYPDMLTARVVNNSSEVVKSYTVVFLAYDENYLPVKIKGNWGKGGEYSYTCLDDEANLIAGATSKEGYGWELDDPHGITYIIACVKEAEFFSGEKWENEYYKYWLENYEGKILPENSRTGLIPYGQ